VILPEVPGGRYYLRIEPDSEARDVNYSIRVSRDVPRWSYFFYTVGALFAVPLVHWFRGRSTSPSLVGKRSSDDLVFRFGGRLMLRLFQVSVL
jgi:hypothetical protein